MADPSTYTVGWICALTSELVAAKSFFDEEYEVTLDAQAPGDNNSYSFGRMGKHDVVVASLPRAEYGIAPAASVARDMLRTFPNIRVGLMVGIGGGAPRPEHDIRLGDVVVSVPSGAKAGVLHHNRGKTIQQQEFQLTGSLNQPPQFLLTAVGALEADYEGQGHELNERIEEALSKRPRLRKRYGRPLAATGRLYESNHIHSESPKSTTCKDNCGEENVISREGRGDDEDDPMIHYGLIASSDKLMKDATIRDKLAREEGVLCFEMEAAGLMNHFPCLIIRGICDYADSHKNKEWQGFAALTAAAYAKELLQKIVPTEIQHEKPLVKVLGEINESLQSITASVKGTSETVNSIQSEKRRLDIERWLKPSRYSTNVVKARMRRHAGSGLWFIHSPIFEEFKAGTRKHLWLHGLAGCGKTVLSSRIFDYLNDTSGIPTLTYYFDFNDVEKQSLDGHFRSLAFQLCQCGGEAALAMLYELFTSCENGSRDPDESHLESCIKSMLDTIGRVFILIDALDECKSKDSLLPWLSRLAEENVQFLLTARPEDDFQHQIVDLFGEDNCLSLDTTAVNNDIKSYVRFRWAACQMDSLEACLTPNDVREALVSLPPTLSETYDLMLENIPPQYKKDSLRLLNFILNCEHPLSPPEAVEVLATRSTPKQDRLRFDPENRLFNFSDIEKYYPGMISIVEVIWEEFEEITCKEVHLTHFSVKEYLRQCSTFCPLNSAIAITQTSLTYLKDINGPFYRMCAEFPLAARAVDIWPRFGKRAQSHKQIAEMIGDFLLDSENISRSYRLFDRTLFGVRVLKEDNGGLFLHIITPYQKSGLQETVKYMLRSPHFEARDDEKEAYLVIAIRNKDPELAEILIRHGISPDASHPSYGPAVNNASQVGLRSLVKALIQAGANVNRWDRASDWMAALSAASEHGHLEIVEDLLKAGAHVGLQDSVKLALENGHTKIVELLRDKACKVGRVAVELLESAASHGTAELVRQLLATNPYRRCKSAALSKACESGRVEIARILLSEGAEDNAIVLAAKSGNENIVRMVLDNTSGLGEVVDLAKEFGLAIYMKKAFVKALEGCHQRALTALLDALVNHAHTKEYDTLRAASEVQSHQVLKDFSVLIREEHHPYFIDTVSQLHEILLGDHRIILQSLLKEAGEKYGATPLHLAAQRECITVVERLLNLGHAVDKKDTIESTPLHSARNKDIIGALLSAGADVNARDFLGWTPLHRVSQTASPEAIRTLLRAKANIFALTNDKRTALHIATEHGSNMIETIKILIENGLDVNDRDEQGSSPLHNACSRSSVKAAALLLVNGADVNAKDNKGTTAFQLATRHPLSRATIDLVSLLVDHGCDVNAQDKKGFTALHDVITRSNIYGEFSYPYLSADIAELLLDQGVDIDARDVEGNTALFRFLECEALAGVELLIKRGADVTVLNIYRETMLHVIKGTNLSLCPILLERGVDVNALTIHGYSPLAHALKRYCWRMGQVRKALGEQGGKNIRNWREEEYNLEE
ncbi:hypothetical protein F25303_6075 [Fusarium sp. NRRL 25303]|nr:hypothetical protein F25303_6075 [Fusarium sp. NRRL 25303]